MASPLSSLPATPSLHGDFSLPPPKRRIALLISGFLAVLVLQNGDHFAPSAAPTSAIAVLLAQDLNVNQDNRSHCGDEYEAHLKQFIKLSGRTACGPFLAGMPELDDLAYPVTPDCPAEPVAPGIIVWPESPAPFSKDPRFLNALRTWRFPWTRR